MIWNYCIRRPVLTVVLFLVFTIFGVYGYMQMPVREYPDVEFPTVNVSVVLPGADPEVIETEVVEPLEEEMNTIEGIDQITSTAREEVGTVTVEFKLHRDVDIAAQDVRDRVTRAKQDLPDDAQEPIVRKVDPDARSVMWIALTGNERWDQIRITQYADNVLKDQLERISGVGQVVIGGEQLYAVRVELDPDKLAAHQITPQDVVRTIQQENVDIPSGRITSEQREFLIKTRGQFSSAEPFNDLIIAHRDGSPVRLSDVGQAREGAENERNVARYRQDPSVGLGIVKQSDANMVELVDRIRSEVDELSRDFPPGLKYDVASDDSQYVRENINDLLSTIFIATALVVLVVMLFLGSPRATIITSIAIPASLLCGMALIFYLGFSLNVLTMLGFILVIGIVVDDAIVVLESCYRHMEYGAEAKPAARTGTTEIAFAAIANTLALGSVFIPVAFMPGMIGRFFNEFGLTVTVTVFASTFTALTLTPMLCSRYLKGPEQTRKPLLLRITQPFLGFLDSLYRPILRTALKWRFVTVAIGVLAFAGGIALFMQLESEFAPSVDKGQFIISFEATEGASLRYTDRYARQIEDVLSGIPEVRSYFLAVGMARTGPGKVNEGISFIRLTHRTERERSQQEIMSEAREKLAGVKGVNTYVLESGGPGGAEAPLQIVLNNPDLDELADQQEKVMDWMRRQPEFVGVHSNMKMDKPEVNVRIDRDKAGEMGVSVTEISNTLRYVFADPEISTIDRQNKRYEVITEINREETVPRAIYNLYTRNEKGQMVSLESLVDIEESVGPSAIHHFNRGRAATIMAETPSGVPLGTALDKLRSHLDRELPADFDTDITGEAQDFKESFFYLTMTLAFSVLFIFLVLSAQFESFLHPFTILMTLPLAGVGAFGALYLLGMTMNIFSFIGLIMLMGLVTKNGILLVDYANVLVARGHKVIDAAREAGQVRFRPVLMTAVSTILGMMPIALGYGAGGTARSPMGVAISMGMLAATALTLLVIPVVYTLFDSLQRTILRHRALFLILAAAVAAAAAVLASYVL
ncbi:MAG: efflux RND transporter permease subunit [Desulfohalobiaceae bacterium]|nr:efflux RND transporter permease subunit [Desulfohalobiaceae bacterium]